MRLPTRYVWRGWRIRLARQGCTNRPFYQIVAMDQHRGRNDRYIEQLGTLDPLPNAHGEVVCGLNFEGIRKWLAKGATMSKPVERLLGLSGFLPIHYMTYITAKRNANRKALQSSQADSAPSEEETTS